VSKGGGVGLRVDIVGSFVGETGEASRSSKGANVIGSRVVAAPVVRGVKGSGKDGGRGQRGG